MKLEQKFKHNKSYNIVSFQWHGTFRGEKKRVTKITQAKFHPKGCQPHHKTSLNKPKKKKKPYCKDSPRPTIDQRFKDSFIVRPQLCGVYCLEEVIGFNILNLIKEKMDVEAKKQPYGDNIGVDS